MSSDRNLAFHLLKPDMAVGEECTNDIGYCEEYHMEILANTDYNRD